MDVSINNPKVRAWLEEDGPIPVDELKYIHTNQVGKSNFVTVIQGQVKLLEPLEIADIAVLHPINFQGDEAEFIRQTAGLLKEIYTRAKGRTLP